MIVMPRIVLSFPFKIVTIFYGNITVIVDNRNSYYIMKCYFLNLTRWTWRLKLTKVCKFAVVLVVNRGSTVVYATLHSFSTSSKISKSAFFRLNFLVQSRLFFYSKSTDFKSRPFVGDRNVGDGYWRQNILRIILKCWWPM